MEMFKYSQIEGSALPLVVEPKNPIVDMEAFLEHLEAHREEFKAKMLKSGGLLFRGFPLRTATDFEEAIRALRLGDFIDYIGGDSPRAKITENVYTSTEAPPSFKIPLHNELSFVDNYPKQIYFFCEIEPTSQGETIIADAREIYKGVRPDVRERFKENGLLYSSCYYGESALMDWINSIQTSHKSWKQVFETNQKTEVERLCQENAFEYQWNQNDWLKISQRRPAVIDHPETGDKVWFNQVHLYDFNPRLLGLWRYVAATLFYLPKHMRLHETFFSNGKPIPREDIYHIMDVLDQKTIAFPWKRGDFMALDNVLAMHGRAPFNCKRRVLTAMTG